MDLGTRILMFFDFCYRNGWEYGISFYENEFYVTVTSKKDGHIISSGQQKTLTGAMDECASGFQKVGAY